MDKFLTVLAWIFGCGSSFIIFVKIVGALTYSDLDMHKDRMNGCEKNYNCTRQFIMAVVCWAWIFTH